MFTNNLWYTKATEHCVVLSTLRTVFRCIALMCSHCHMWLKSRLCVFISIHGHRHAHLFLSVLFTPSLYFFLKSFFHLFLMSTLVPDENFMEDPLCNSSFGSMVSLYYVTPDTWRPVCVWQMQWCYAMKATQSTFFGSWDHQDKPKALRWKLIFMGPWRPDMQFAIQQLST